jgi:hypothetical protein
LNALDKAFASGTSPLKPGFELGDLLSDRVVGPLRDHLSDAVARLGYLEQHYL